MNIKPRAALTVLLALTLAVSLFQMARQTLGLQQGRADHADALSAANASSRQQQQQDAAPEPPERPTPPPESGPAPEQEPAPYDRYAGELANTDLAPLREVNSDVLGWILIPETEINHPLLQGEDNEFYLTHTWKKLWSSMGSIFLECQVSPDLSDFNTIVYGHQMRDGSMFSSLHNYADIGYWREHPSVYIRDSGSVRRYDIFSAYEAEVTDITYGLDISEKSSKELFIQFSLDSSVIDTGIRPEAGDSILTLSTCSGADSSVRWVAQAVLARQWPLES